MNHMSIFFVQVFIFIPLFLTLTAETSSPHLDTYTGEATLAVFLHT